MAALQVDITLFPPRGGLVQGGAKRNPVQKGLYGKTTVTVLGRYLCVHKHTKPSGENVPCWKMLSVALKSSLPVKTHYFLKEGRYHWPRQLSYLAKHTVMTAAATKTDSPST